MEHWKKQETKKGIKTRPIGSPRHISFTADRLRSLISGGSLSQCIMADITPYEREQFRSLIIEAINLCEQRKQLLNVADRNLRVRAALRDAERTGVFIDLAHEVSKL